MALEHLQGPIGGGRDYNDALLFGLRAELWPCDLGAFWDRLTGNDDDQPLDEQPGNQLAGFDVRWSRLGGRVPVALYAQGIGEYEVGFLPSKSPGLLVVEDWGGLGDGSWRLRVEYADTACDVNSSQPECGCAYDSAICPDAYRYRGWAIGRSIDGDGESVSVGVLYLDRQGHDRDLLARNVKLKRTGRKRRSLARRPSRSATQRPPAWARAYGVTLHSRSSTPT